VFDENFQKEVLSLFVQDSIFLGQFHDTILPEHFEVVDFKNICKLINDYTQEYYEPPSKAALLMLAKGKKLDHILSKIEDLYEFRSASHQQFIRDNALRFAKIEALKRAIRTSSMMIKKGEVEGLEEIILKALQHGYVDDVGSFLFRDADTRASFREEDLGDPIPTLWHRVDEYWKGGSFPTELNCLLAGTNKGKSAILVNLGVAAVAMGKTVFHYTLEMSANRVLNRYDSRLTLSTTEDLMSEDVSMIDDIKSKLKRWSTQGGEVVVKEYPPNTCTIPMLRAHIDRVKMENGLKPDMVIVDYGDLLKHTYFKEYRHQVGNTFTELRKLACDLDIVVWSATQTNRVGLTKATPDLEDVAEDISKIQISDNILVFCQTKNEYDLGEGRLFGAKCRNGPKGWVVPLRINLDKMAVMEKRNVRSTG